MSLDNKTIKAIEKGLKTGLNPLDDLGKMVLYCPYCGAENIIFVSYATGGSDECWCCSRVIHWSIEKRKIFVDQYTDDEGNIVENEHRYRQ